MALSDSPFLKACRREPVAYTPIWLMRQAGRYMKEYREVREKNSFLDLCKNSDLAAEVTVYAANRLGVDAAIIFSDLLLILEPMGLRLEYTQGDGPAIYDPVRSPEAVEKLRIAAPESLAYVYSAIRKTRASLPAELPLIGFCGAPFTLASYMVEGSGSRDYTKTRALMHNEPQAWARLMEKLVLSLGPYLNAQIRAGAQAVQIFDSWVGTLSAEEYRLCVLPHVQHLIRQLTPGVPVIYFGTGTAHLLELMRDAGGSVMGIDSGITLDAAWKRLGDVAVMGNLDPKVLFESVEVIRRNARQVLDQAAGRPGHIFNLGHGVLQNTPVEHVKALVDMVHEMSIPV